MTLKQRLLERIRTDGPITFAAFMEAALYDPDDGFYSQPPVGPRGDFVTSPHISTAFGFLLQEQLKGMWKELGSPAEFTVIEAGAGDGTLATAIIDAAEPPFDEALRYKAVEISAGARHALKQKGIDVAETIKGAGHADVVFANELIDNLPFHRLRNRAGTLVEVYVDENDDRLVEIEGEPVKDALDALGDEAVEGERLVSPATIKFVTDACDAIDGQGWVVLYDYALTNVRAYAGHDTHGDVLAEPGKADITAGADFDALAREARKHGRAVFGPCTQRDVLKALGFDEWYAGIRERRLAAEERRDTRTTLKLISEQSRAPLLIDPAHLGSLMAIAIGVGTDAHPPGF